MKIYFVIALVLCSKITLAQLYETFDDGNFSTNPAWTGSNSSADFTVISDQLHSNSTTASSGFYLSTENSLATNCVWEFWCNLKFATSGSNYVDVYLISDKQDLQSAAVNGYFVRIGNTDDEVSLYRQSGPKSGAQKIIDGANGVVSSSTNNLIKVRVTRTSDNIFLLERDGTGTGTSYVSEGSVTDASFLSSSYFGIFIQQSTSSFFQKHFFDDIKINPIIIDSDPPKLISATASDSSHLIITFSEAVDTLSAKLVINYKLDNSTMPISVKLTSDPAQLILDFGRSFETGSHRITVLNVTDKAGNKISDLNKATFTYLKPYVAAWHDIVINEIFADPSPQIDLPSTEFIEIYNNSSHSVSLKNWKFSDPTNIAVLPDDSLKAGEYRILCAKADTAEFKRFGKVIGVSPWPSLNNSSDVIKLKNGNGITIDSVSYSDAWYKDAVKKQGGWSLERVDPKSVCQGNYNWTASVDSAGGTPGRQNSVFKKDYDLTDFKIESFRRPNDTTITVKLSKHLDTNTLLAEAFSSQPAINYKNISADSEGTLISLTHNLLTPGTNYSFNVIRLNDCSGKNLIASPAFLFTTPKSIPERTDTAKILISEIFADPSPEVGLPLVEYVELYNPGKDTIDLDGYSLNDATSKGVIKKVSIFPNSYLILCPATDSLQYKPFGKVGGLSPWPSLNNSSDQIVLKSFKGKLVDSVSYSDTWYKDAVKKQGGWSLEVINPDAACKNAQNWTASNDKSGGTPGRINSVFNKNQPEALKLLSATLTDNTTIRLNFNRLVDSISAVKLINYQVNNGLAAPGNAVLIGPDFQSIDLKFPSIKRGLSYKITVENLTDCAGSVISSGNNTAEFYYPFAIEKGEILINEVLFNPRPNGVDFVEIYNNSDKTFDLKELNIATIKSKDSIESVKQISGKSQLFKPKEYTVLASDIENIKAEYHTENSESFIKLSSMPSYNDDEGIIVLISNNQRIDQLNYSEKMHFPLIKNPEGVSLERSSFSRPTNDPGNFRSAAAAVGFATPGYRNSQFVDDVNPEDEVSLSSKTFSPDNDGFEDVLNINYKFPNPGMVANVIIYNSRGVTITHLIKNMTLPATGIFSWDGLNENQQKSAVGIYFMQMEVFNLNGKVKKYTKSFALAARLN
ncbi:hypothetical protein GS399_18880 [Pedobacter sp. HMF7647]|uniref:LTD domain-containing protein n=1 Tax=Hufsiella arboris TaxID=2695275 RepID=A0A7K1YF47_9SPHI|nr:lamin tail domain-containing protein [Hufsiella arboris]MXV53040.1 hypothetical protein [Hufsiella arboris]